MTCIARGRTRRALHGTVLALALGCLPAAAQSPFVVGMNVANPQWLSPADRAAVLDQLVAAKVDTVRIPFVPPTGGDDDAAVELVRGISARGLKVVLILYLEYREGVPARPRVPGHPEMWSLPPLSAADEARFQRRYAPVLAKLDRAGVKLRAIELDNEINWAAFNGAFPVPGSGRLFTLDDLRTDPLGRKLADGFRAYLKTAAALKRIRNGLSLNRTTPILSAGLSDYGQGGARPNLNDAVDIDATLQYLRFYGLDDIVDGYGVHAYPEIGTTPANRAEVLRTVTLAQCRTDKPCWLTEWGVPSPGTACGLDDRPRAAIVDEMRARFRDFHREGRLKAALFFSWSGDGDPNGVYRCGRLTGSGVKAIAPIATPRSGGDRP